MTPAKLKWLVQFRTHTGDNQFTDTEIKNLANIYIEHLAPFISGYTKGKYFGSIATTDLVEDQREYTLPSDYMGMLRLEANLLTEDGGDDNKIKLKNLEVLGTYQVDIDDESEIIARFTNADYNSFYQIYRNAIRIYSGTIYNKTNGLKLWYYQQPQPITDLTSTVDMSEDPTPNTVGIPKLFHEPLATAIVREKKTRGDRPRQTTQKDLLQAFEKDLLDVIEILSDTNDDESQDIIMPSYYNNGFDI